MSRATAGVVRADAPHQRIEDREYRSTHNVASRYAADLIHERFGIPVVFLSAHNDESTRQRIEASHAYGLVVKPFDERDVYMAVKSALHRRRIEGALAPVADGPVPALPQSPLAEHIRPGQQVGCASSQQCPPAQAIGWLAGQVAGRSSPSPPPEPESADTR